MKFELLFLGRTREAYLAVGMDDFLKRLRHYTRVEVKTIKTKSGAKSVGNTMFIAAEAEQLLAARTPQSLLVALDRCGRQLTSEEFAGRIGDWEMQGVKCVTIVIGGELGLAESITRQADFVLSLSEMTFTHEMTRLILLEQLYRAYTIKAGEKYHK